jgi:hypothetical protein
MISYNLAPIPLWVLRDNTGEPLANGYMKAYRNTVRSQFKAVYQNPAGTIAWVQPIVFNAAGFQGPFYWASDENYYLEIFDVNNNIVRTIPDFNAPQDGGIVPVTINNDFTNFIYDSQFNFALKTTFSPLTVSQQIGSGNWFFVKTNTSATDEIKIVAFLPGSALPLYNPPNYFSYECSVPGSGELIKDLYFVFEDVNSFQNSTISIAFWGQSTTLANPVEVRYFQYFGTGGTPSASVDQTIQTFNLTPIWAPYVINGTAIASIAGKTLGTNRDSSFQIRFRLPQDAASTINLTNIQLNNTPTLQSFDYLTKENITCLQIPPFNSYTEKNAFPYINFSGHLGWANRNDVFIECNSGVTNIGTSNTLIPLVFTGGFPSTWISGGRITPDKPCVVIVSGWANVESSGFDTFYIKCLFDGIDTIYSASYPFVLAQTTNANIPINAMVEIGLGHSLEFVGVKSAVGGITAQIGFLAITIIL